MKGLLDAIVAAAMDNLLPILVSSLFALVALGYRRALLKAKALVKETPSQVDDQAFEALEAELRKRKLLPEGYDDDIKQARTKVLKTLGKR